MAGTSLTAQGLPFDRQQPVATIAMPPVTQTLLIVNIAIYIAQAMFGDTLIRHFALWPLTRGLIGAPGFELWQLVTYSFLHGNLLHLFVNMYALYMFGGDLERLWGPKRYLSLYLAGVITAGVTQLFVSGMAAMPPYPTVGASGGVFGLLLAFALYFPRRVIMLLIPPVPLPAWLFATLYAMLELYLGVTGTQQGVAHFAHLGGMLGAWIMIRYWRRQPPFSTRRN
jgi:membrane associated rhomboid family serine protease